MRYMRAREFRDKNFWKMTAKHCMDQNNEATRRSNNGQQIQNAEDNAPWNTESGLA